MPTVLVFAGPNGSGKSTITSKIPSIGEYINADELKKRLGCSDLEAAQFADGMRKHCIENRMDFTFETVLSTDRNLEILRTAKANGYRIQSVFVMTATPVINVLRIRGRVSRGGHGVPPKLTVKRYYKSVCNLGELLELSDVCSVYDNTDSDPQLVLCKSGSEHEYISGIHWSTDQLEELVSI